MLKIREIYFIIYIKKCMVSAMKRNNMNKYKEIIDNLKIQNLTEKHIKIHYPEFYSIIMNMYTDTIFSKFSERLYWYYHDLDHRPLCKTCGKELRYINFTIGYGQYCCAKCSNSNIEKKNKGIKTIIDKYGGLGFGSNIINEHIKSTNKDRFGVENVSKNRDIRAKQRRSCIERYGGQGNASTVLKEKQRNTCLEKYGIDNYARTKECREKMRQTCLERYGVDSFSKTKKFSDAIKLQHDIINTKRNITKKTNNSFNKSTIEIKFRQYLEDNNINFIYQYYSELYPFNCDFYFPDKDIYLEIDAGWTHGGHPFDPINDKDKLNLWIEKSKTSKFYEAAIETWTISDPKKVRVAKENKIKLYSVYSNNLNEVISFCKENDII